MFMFSGIFYNYFISPIIKHLPYTNTTTGTGTHKGYPYFSKS